MRAIKFAASHAPFLLNGEYYDFISMLPSLREELCIFINKSHVSRPGKGIWSLPMYESQYLDQYEVFYFAPCFCIYLMGVSGVCKSVRLIFI